MVGKGMVPERALPKDSHSSLGLKVKADACVPPFCG